MLETGSLDIGFLRLPIGERSTLDVIAVNREPVVLVVPPSNRLAKKKSGSHARTGGSGLRDV
jgi:DNA-binding transcriptional LysR family regulator